MGIREAGRAVRGAGVGWNGEFGGSLGGKVQIWGWFGFGWSGGDERGDGEGRHDLLLVKTNQTCCHHSWEFCVYEYVPVFRRTTPETETETNQSEIRDIWGSGKD